MRLVAPHLRRHARRSAADPAGVRWRRARSFWTSIRRCSFAATIATRGSGGHVYRTWKRWPATSRRALEIRKAYPELVLDLTVVFSRISPGWMLATRRPNAFARG